ncbi:MAG: carboxypeptidase regulatory-like domain-containing protein [Flavobacterium sp.]
MTRILSGLLFFISALCFAQNVKVEGTIKDSTGVALEMANIMAVNKATNAMDSYAITDEKGRYQLLLKANTNYILKASYIGYNSFEEELQVKGENIVKNISLKQGVELDAVEVVHEMPVTIKGDTIVYNSDSFTNGTERKLEDVLKKLPGVEVNADGEVQVEGKRVTKLMVEGKDFFDGDTKLGVKNIPADALKKIEVLRNYNEVSQLKGLENNEENVAMNIKLKDGKKNFWFGEMLAGASIGEGERYIVNPKVFYYSPEYSLNIIANFNNNGELPLTFQDYIKFTGGLRNLMRKGGTSFNISSNDLGITGMRNNRAKEIEAKFGAANFSYNPTQAWTLSGFAIFNSNKTDMETKSRTQVLDPVTGEPQTTQDTEEYSRQKNEFGLFKLSSSYKPNANVHFDYDAFMKVSKQTEDQSLYQVVTPETSQSQDIYTGKEQSPFSFNQNINFYYTLDEKNVFAVEAQHLYQQEDPLYNANLENNPFPDAPFIDPLLNLGLAPASRYDISQDRFIKTNKVDAKADYYYSLTPRSIVNLTFGTTFSRQDFNSNIFQRLDDGNIDNLDANSKNDVDFTFSDVFLALHYKFITGKFTFNPGLSLHKYNSNNRQLGTEAEQDFYRVLPDMYALFQIKKAERLRYNYSMTTEFTDVANFTNNVIFTSYRSLFRGNRNLENALYQSHTLDYSKYNAFNFTNIFGRISYSHRMDAVKSLAGFNGINQISTVENSNFADEMITGAAGYDRSFERYYKASVGLLLTWNKFNNFRFDPAAIGAPLTIENSIRQENESFAQNYYARLSTNYKEWPNLELGYNLTINDYADNIFYRHSPTARIDYFFLNAFTVTAEYEYNSYYNDAKTVDNTFDFLSANVMYRKPGTKWEFRVGGTNLLNTTSLNDDSFNQFSTRTSRYRVQPRYLLLSVRYSL